MDLGSGKKVKPGASQTAVPNGKINSSVPSGANDPSGAGQTSGVVQHNRSGKGNKSENLKGFPA